MKKKSLDSIKGTEDWKKPHSERELSLEIPEE